MELILKDISELSTAVTAMLDAAQGRKVWLLTGEIGAGKTTFTKELCARLGVTDHVVSPTFSLVNEYHSAQEGTIRHLDLYRLKTADEAIDIGIEDFLYEGEYCLIEWPEIIEPILPDDCFRLHIEITESGHRKFIYS